MSHQRPYTVGVLSDTHGLVRAEVLRELESVDLILHAGDVGRIEVLRTLEKLAPLVAVRGNVDRGDWARSLPPYQTVQLDAVRLYLLHELSQLAIDPAQEGYSAVISGHSHRPSIRHEKNVMYLNPGGAGPRRFRLPITVAKIQIQGRCLSPEIIELKV